MEKKEKEVLTVYMIVYTEAKTETQHYWSCVVDNGTKDLTRVHWTKRSKSALVFESAQVAEKFRVLYRDALKAWSPNLSFKLDKAQIVCKDITLEEEQKIEKTKATETQKEAVKKATKTQKEVVKKETQKEQIAQEGRLVADVSEGLSDFCADAFEAFLSDNLMAC